jgi:AbrB family looped-hinge helix DNA binding protein
MKGVLQMNNISTITSKGQIVIPAWLRKKLGIKAGMRVSFTEQGNDIIVHPQTKEYFRQFAGMWGTDDKAVKFLLEERRKDNEKENAKIRRSIRS